MRKVSVHRYRTKWQGHYLRRNGTLGPNTPGGVSECVNVTNSAAQLVGIASSFGNAIELDYPNCQYVDNTPDNYPPPGAGVIFYPEYPYDSEFGHTGWALGGSTNTELHILWQNDPEGHPCVAVWTDYTAVSGWWIFKTEFAEFVH